ncbi:MAG: hypothetical protein WC244_04195 [Patescibacteria group bacterium]|jgi:nicotinate phosphoribosyltransferase
MNCKTKDYEIDISDIPLLEYTNIFISNLTWINRGIDKDIATFDLVVRDMPEYWNFYLFNGLEKFIDMLLNFKYDEEAIKLMKKMGLIDSKKTESFYRNFKFSGDVWAMKDGAIFFPGEPIVRITAPLVEANLLTAFVTNVFGYPIRILSKTARLKFATEGTTFIAASIVRLPGFEQGVEVARAAYLLEANLGAVPMFFRKFKKNVSVDKIFTNINHAFIKSFGTEREAFRYVLDVLLEKKMLFWVMIDTYEIKKGLDIFIEEIKATPKVDYKRFMITIDSGNVKELAFYVRKTLDKNGLRDIKIQAMSNLDEYIIDDMAKDKTPVDCYVSATALINVVDNPRFEAVYKMAELIHEDGTIEQKAKLTKGKESYPGRKQIFRVYDKNGKIKEDIIGIESEKLGVPMLHKAISRGKRVGKAKTLEEIRENIKKELKTLPTAFKAIKKPVKYKVTVSKKLSKMVEGLRVKHIN